MTKWAELTPATINQIAFEVRDGVADPEDVRRILTYYCDRIDMGEPVPAELTTYLRDSLKRFLEEGKTVESALGLARREGRRPADAQIRRNMAAEVLRNRMTGVSHQDALDLVSAKFSRSQSIIGKAWKDHKFDAVIILRLERPSDQYPWSAEEVERLRVIFADEPWFIAPLNSPS